MSVAAESIAAAAAEEASAEVRAAVAAELRRIVARAEALGVGFVHTATLEARAAALEEGR